MANQADFAVQSMGLISSQLVDRINIRTGLALLVPMLLLGAASVIYWRATERAGVGNVLPYEILQGYSVVIVLLLAMLSPSRYTRGNRAGTLWQRIPCYPRTGYAWRP